MFQLATITSSIAVIKSHTVEKTKMYGAVIARTFDKSPIFVLICAHSSAYFKELVKIFLL
jgi:hypothetical protein